MRLSEAKQLVFRSLRTRIILLALFASLLLIAAGVSFFFFLNSSQRARLDSARKHLDYLASAMSREYAAQLPHGASLRTIQPSAPPPPPPPPHQPPKADTKLSKAAIKPLDHPPHPEPPAPDAAALALSSVTASVLRHDPDVEGGFFSAHADALTGYAFPTHEGPGGRGEIPGKERPEIEDLARAATQAGKRQQQGFHGAYDAILFVAVPIREGTQITGAAWLMQRMPGLEAGRSQQLLLGSIGFAIAALTCILFTVFVTTEVSTGVQTVLTRLGVMEGNLGEHPQRSKRQLAEFERVLERVDELSNTLNQKIVTQRALEDEVRHRQRLSSLGQFAAGVAHELRNPLATIRLRTQMSQRMKDEASVARNSAVVLEEITRLDTMIERLLYFSRPIRLRLERVSVQELCQNTTEEWQTRCQAVGVAFRCNVPAGLQVCCDASTIRQVMDNLLSNALHALASAATENPTVELCGRQMEDLIVIEVRDNGSGLDPETITHALEPFFTTRDTGTGLGLSISYEIMQAHGGNLQLRNGELGGAVATLSMPAVPAEGKSQ